jgi:single-strand selective monofunctional uracil DNA glycosylase
MSTIATEMRAAARRLVEEVRPLRFAPPVTHVYNPLEYAWACHQRYIDRYGATRKRAVLLGMNPGPFGMAQTGVPFGDVASVRDFLGIVAPVGRPAEEHPARPVLGFACTRGEVSGTRVWGLVARLWGSAAAFFAGFYVANYCPLVFVEGEGKNRTPDKLPAGERGPLQAACDRHLRRIVEVLQPEWVIGVGGFAEKQARAAVGERVRIGHILHPSPASPAANRGWAEAVTAELAAMGLAPAPARAAG